MMNNVNWRIVLGVFIILCMAGLLVFSVSHNTKSEPVPVDTIAKDTYSNWELKYYVDEFGDHTKDTYLANKYILHGTFSNSVSNSPLDVNIIIDDTSSVLRY